MQFSPEDLWDGAPQLQVGLQTPLTHVHLHRMVPPSDMNVGSKQPHEITSSRNIYHKPSLIQPQPHLN